jgi:REP element-mobilizing transposase RayT
VTSRGNGGQPVFLDDADRESLIAALAEVIERTRWLCHGYCLMENHYHPLIETPDANLSHGMRQLGTLYAQVQSLQPFFAEKADLSEVPRQQRLAHRPPLKVLFAHARSQRARDDVIRAAHVQHGYTLIDIGRHLGLHYTTISKAARRTDKR